MDTAGRGDREDLMRATVMYEAGDVRVPQASGTLVKLPGGADEALLASLLTLSDVFCTGHHAAVRARVSPRTSVTVIGDGAVGLCAVLAARRLGAEQILLMGHHKERTDLGRAPVPTRSAKEAHP